MQCKICCPTLKLNKDHENISCFARERQQWLYITHQLNVSLFPQWEKSLFSGEIRAPSSGVELEAPIAYWIQRTPFATAYNDAYLHSAGSYSICLQCVWWLTFPDFLVKCTVLHSKDSIYSDLISINVLNYQTMIINYCAAYVLVTTRDVTDAPT
jgi:hypothetical protein